MERERKKEGRERERKVNRKEGVRAGKGATSKNDVRLENL